MKGFTLVEMLVVLAIVAIIGTILTLIFTNTLRGSNQSQVLAVIKQNGQAVLENMDKIIRNADHVVCPSSKCLCNDGNTLVVIKDGLYTRFRLDPATPTANGSISQDFPVQPSPPDPKSVQQTFLNAVCKDSMGTDSIAPQVFTDSNLQTGVSVQNIPAKPFFTVNQDNGSRDSVTIQFQLSPAVGLPDTVKNQIDPVAFQTTIQLR